MHTSYEGSSACSGQRKVRGNVDFEMFVTTSLKSNDEAFESGSTPRTHYAFPVILFKFSG